MMRKSNNPGGGKPRQREALGRAVPFLVTACIVAATVGAVWPVGNFPLNDDWIYARIAYRLLDAGGAYVGHPYSMSRPVAQAYWGAAFVLAFGRSFDVLRLSSGILAMVALTAVYGTARRLGTEGPAALLGVLVLWSNPLFMNLSFTFMTDIPFVTLVALSIWAYVAAFQPAETGQARLRPAAMFLGTTASMAALFVRQFGLLPAVAGVVVVFWQWRRGRLHVDWRSIAAMLVPIGVAAILWIYYSVSLDSHFTYRGSPLGGDPLVRLLGTARFMVTVMLYVGLFLLPVTALLIVDRIMQGGRRAVLRLAASGAAATAIFLWTYAMDHMPLLPAWPNVLYNLGVGPLTLRDTTILTPGWTPVALPPLVWASVTLAAFLSALMLLSALGQTAFGGSRHLNVVQGSRLGLAFLAASMLLGAVYNPWLPIVYDRYVLNGLVVLVAVTVALVSQYASKTALWAGYLTVAAMLAFSICANQDYFAWNRARWEAIDRLKTEFDAEPLRIDGGFEYNGWYLSNAYMEKHQTTDFNDRGEKGWWVMDDTYAVSFLPRRGYEELGVVSYRSYLGFTERSLRILRRREGP